MSPVPILVGGAFPWLIKGQLFVTTDHISSAVIKLFYILLSLTIKTNQRVSITADFQAPAQSCARVSCCREHIHS